MTLCEFLKLREWPLGTMVILKKQIDGVRTREVSFTIGRALDNQGLELRPTECNCCEACARGDDYSKHVVVAYSLPHPVWSKALTPDHGFNSERSQHAENGGRP